MRTLTCTMITVKSLADAQVLIIGNDDLSDTILRILWNHGVQYITMMNADGPTPAVNQTQCKFIQKEAHDYIKADTRYFETFDLILAANQPRAFELALSDVRWPKDGHNCDGDPDRPMIVMRSVGNICKMRCQYRELPVNGNNTSQFVSLPMDLLPWTDKKRALIASIMREEFLQDSTSRFQAYLTAATAVVDFQESNGSWPGEKDQKQLWDKVSHRLTSEDMAAELVAEYIDQLCRGGFGSVPETISTMAHLISLDAMKLLTGSGQPINNVNVEEVIRIASSAQ